MQTRWWAVTYKRIVVLINAFLSLPLPHQFKARKWEKEKTVILISSGVHGALSTAAYPSFPLGNVPELLCGSQRSCEKEQQSLMTHTFIHMPDHLHSRQSASEWFSGLDPVFSLPPCRSSSLPENSKSLQPHYCSAFPLLFPSASPSFSLPHSPFCPSLPLLLSLLNFPNISARDKTS